MDKEPKEEVEGEGDETREGEERRLFVWGTASFGDAGKDWDLDESECPSALLRPLC